MHIGSQRARAFHPVDIDNFTPPASVWPCGRVAGESIPGEVKLV